VTESGREARAKDHPQRDVLARERIRISDEFTAIADERDRQATARDLASGVSGPSCDPLHRDRRAVLAAARLRDEAAMIRDLAANRRDLEANHAADTHSTGGTAMVRGRECAREDRVAARRNRMASAIDRSGLCQRSVPALVSQ
jgi:hypothetical protein